MANDVNPTLAPDELPRFLTLRGAATYAGVHVRTARRWVDQGRLKATRVAGRGSTLRIRRDDLLRLLGEEAA